MATLAITNLGLRSFQHPIAGKIDPDGVTRTYTLKTNEIDITRGDYDNLAKFGIVISESGTLRPGTIVVTTTATILATQKCVIVDAVATSYTITLPALAGIAAGASLFIYIRTNTSATITIDGNAAETIIGVATQALTVAGTFLRLAKDSATNWKAYTV
jgi:hypothetical protein